MNHQTAQVDDLQLIALPSAVNCTDIFVRFALTEWSLRPMADEAVQAASHLVQTAVDNNNPKSPSLITVRLRLRGDCLVIELEDEQMIEQPAVPSELEEYRSGVEPMSNGQGKRVWCELPLPGGVEASAVPLPRRERKRSTLAEQLPDEATEVDPQVMERLLSGLNRNSYGGTGE
ncbi:hypothetical protein [Parasphingorhabdus pacifica]